MIEIAFIAASLGLAAAVSVEAWRARRRLTQAAEQARLHRRALGLLAQDLGASGLRLAGKAERLPAPHGAEIGSEARQLSALADSVTEHLAAMAGPRGLVPEPVPLSALLDEAVAATSAQLGPAGRHWRVAPEFGGITMRADRRALQGALLPVLARAARSTRDGDWIDLRPVITPESVAIVVEDEGAGLAAPDLTTAMAITEADRTRGLGFGLATARALMEAHGGGLRLEAVQGVGARAWLTLPRERLLAPA